MPTPVIKISQPGIFNLNDIIQVKYIDINTNYMFFL